MAKSNLTGDERMSAVNPLGEQNICLECKDFSLFYGDKQALYNINLQIPTKQVTAFIGPSGCGKSTLLRCMNRMNDLIDNVNLSGELLLNGKDLNSRSVNVTDLRRQVGMVFQNPIRSQNLFLKMLLMDYAYRVSTIKVNSKIA